MLLCLLRPKRAYFKLKKWTDKTDSHSKQGASVQSAGIEFTGFWTDGQIGQVFYSFLEK